MVDPSRPIKRLIVLVAGDVFNEFLEFYRSIEPQVTELDQTTDSYGLTRMHGILSYAYENKGDSHTRS